MTTSALSVKISPLEAWIAQRIGLDGHALTRDHINRYQVRKLQETLSLALNRSPFYRKLLQGGATDQLARLTDLQRLPFTTPEDIRQQGQRFLCVSQSDISRVVTLDSSGTTGPAKRVYFTPSDQKSTINFFQHGMAALVEHGDRVLILLPGERPGSVGDLLATALRRLGVEPVPFGLVCNVSEVLHVMEKKKVNTLVGIPVQVLALARYADQIAHKPFRLKSVLLSTDHVPLSIVRTLEQLWKCQVFEHYGMTEMGLGGGTGCAAHAGYHLHEADFYIEIVDPLTGSPLPEGQEGEVVVTTLTRQGMPLIRYRTGDLSHVLPERCPCGSIVRRLGRITKRKNNDSLCGDHRLTIADLDEALFAMDEIVSFTATNELAEKSTLTIDVSAIRKPAKQIETICYNAIHTIPSIAKAITTGQLSVKFNVSTFEGRLMPTSSKRGITEVKAMDK